MGAGLVKLQNKRRKLIRGSFSRRRRSGWGLGGSIATYGSGYCGGNRIPNEGQGLKEGVPPYSS